MKNEGYLTEAEYNEAVNFELIFTNSENYVPDEDEEETKKDTENTVDSFYVDYVRQCVQQDLMEQYGYSKQQAQDKIWGVLGNSYVIYEGDKILIVDSLPKETATNVIMINNGGIGFSQSGITGPFQSAWTIDNVLNMELINVIGLTADMIKSGTLKLGSIQNQNGILEVYDEANTLIAELNKDGLKMYGVDGSYIIMNTSVGFSGYDRNGDRIYWVDGEEFHQKKSVVEEEITLCGKMRYIAIRRFEDVYGNDLFDYTKCIRGTMTNHYGNEYLSINSNLWRVYLIECEPNTTYNISEGYDTTYFVAAYCDKSVSYIQGLSDGDKVTTNGFTEASSVMEFNITTNSEAQTLLVYVGDYYMGSSTDVHVKKVTNTLVNDGIGLVAVGGGE
jgi:hypothetical protein